MSKHFRNVSGPFSDRMFPLQDQTRNISCWELIQKFRPGFYLNFPFLSVSPPAGLGFHQTLNPLQQLQPQQPPQPQLSSPQPADFGQPGLRALITNQAAHTFKDFIVAGSVWISCCLYFIGFYLLGSPAPGFNTAPADSCCLADLFPDWLLFFFVIN